jgi:Glycosyl hydrolase family 79 C-terminal beta domain
MHHRGRGIGALVALACTLILLGSAGAVADGASGALDGQVSGQITRGSMPPGFLGFSFEYRALHMYTGRDPAAVNPLLVSLIGQLNPGQAPNIRIGGNSADQTWWPMPGVIPPGGINYALTKGWLRMARAFTTATGAKLILDVNLAVGRPAIAAQEARALVAGVGRQNILALEIGNEADLYGQFNWYRDRLGEAVPARPSSYDLGAYLSDFTRWRHVLPHLPLAGPAFAGLSWMSGLSTFLADEPGLGYVTFHRYPLRGCISNPLDPSYASIPNLLADSSAGGLAQSVAPFTTTAHGRGLRFRLDELNSAACTGRTGVSDTFASALWALDTLFNLAAVGVDGINLHTLPNAAYQPFTFREVHGSWTATVRPVYYGLLMFAEAFPPGAQLLGTSIPDGPVKLWATRSSTGSLHIVLINKDPMNPANVHLQVTGNPSSLSMQTLTAPSIDATTGVTFGGQSFAAPTSTGRLEGTAQFSTITPLLGTYSVDLPPASAVMLSR